jgi:hypothetical protein
MLVFHVVMGSEVNVGLGVPCSQIDIFYSLMFIEVAQMRTSCSCHNDKRPMGLDSSTVTRYRNGIRNWKHNT